MENVRAYDPGTGYGTGYHGYWVQNYCRVNAPFGTWDDVDQLSHEMHAREMRHIQDITHNRSNLYRRFQVTVSRSRHDGTKRGNPAE
jgi:alpha-amylase